MERPRELVERVEPALLDRVERERLVDRLVLLAERPGEVERELPDLELELADFERELPDERAPVDLLREPLVVRRLEPLLDRDPDPLLAWGMFPPWDL